MAPLALSLFRPGHPEIRKREAALAAAEHAFRLRVTRWQDGDPSNVVREEKETLRWIHFELIDQGSRRHQDVLAEAKAKAHARALERFLEWFELRPGDVPGIGKPRLKTLNGFGIETAADITSESLDSVPGLGRTLRGGLLAWRKGKERLFSPPQSLQLDGAGLAQIEASIMQEAPSLLVKLSGGEERPQTLADSARQEMATFRQERERAAQAVAQARADLEALLRGH